MSRADETVLRHTFDKLSNVPGVFRQLDAGRVLGAVGPTNKALKPPALGTFGVKSSIPGTGIVKRADDACGGVTNAEIKTTEEEYRAPIAKRSKTSAEKMDEERWKQTLKDIPLVILATGLGWGIGKTISGAVGERLAREGVRPEWTKHIPAATALLSSVGSYAMGRSRGEMARRRDEAGARSPQQQVQEKLSGEFSVFVGSRLARRP